MYLSEIKKRVYALIEELNPDSEYLTDDVDYQAKINYCIDSIQNELARIKRIARVETMNVKKGDSINLYEELQNFYKLGKIEGVNYDIFNNIVTFEEDGEVTIYYYKYPKKITADTKDEEYKFELSQDVLEIMPYGVAGDLLKADISAQYGQVYTNAYNQALQRLDISTSDTTYQIVGGIDV